MGKLQNKYTDWLKKLINKNKLTISLLATVVIIYILYQFNWSGFGEDSNKSVTIKEVINPKDGKFIKLTETTEYFQSGKTFWDWLGLAGTLAIPIVLFQFERREQKRADNQAEAEKQRVEKQAEAEKQKAEKEAELEKAIADNNLREEALEAYINRMSELLLEKNLNVSDPSRGDTAFDVARARTLSVLRRLDKDGERKGSVIQFLIDTELISKLNLSDTNLDGAILTNADLSDAKLIRAKLTSAKLTNAILTNAHLDDAIFDDANINSATLDNASLTRASFMHTNLIQAQISHGQLMYANFAGANLADANLIRANLAGANLAGANLDGANLQRAENISIDQIKSANNWEKAKYDEDFRTKLGFPPEDAK
ncbi:pentapeptide repeat-containing protein [Nostoc flagelliforme]|uniref:Pentapeptide repeat protein n=1 Tax=Nostoc flagelliforme str. Sunitezuoqi TaxID=676037 RepID=E7DQ95_9NOSO|nr:pentapeptide repeat-containing protein [Nostoc flagelliforme]ADO19253.1 pentapeptide repeat protein [Nostoc flagelliforme str. Sunitezuoqi]